MDGFLASAGLAAAPIIVEGEGSGSIAALLLYISLAIGISFLCSVLEAVLLSTTIAHAEMMAQSGRRSGLIMRRLRENVERPISAILTLNTIAHTAGATLAGAEAARIFGDQLVGLISAALTFMILVFSEIIPKTLGAVYWRQLTPFAAYAIQAMLFVLGPLVWGFEQLGRRLRPEDDEPTVSRTDLEVMAQIGQREGALQERENRILTNLLHLHNVKVYDIMTPRTVVMALQEDMTIAEVMAEHPNLAYSRIPVYRETLDDVTGYVLRHDIVSRAASDLDDVKLSTFRRDIHMIPETLDVARVFDEFIRTKEHIFLVLDEYGGMAGILTMEDAVESLLGIEITDESDLVTDLRQLAQQRYQRKFIQSGETLDLRPDDRKDASASGDAAPGSERPGQKPGVL